MLNKLHVKISYDNIPYYYTISQYIHIIQWYTAMKFNELYLHAMTQTLKQEFREKGVLPQGGNVGGS